MGKRIRRAALFLCLLLAVRMGAALASGQLPRDIRAQFGSVEILDTACWDGPGSAWFVLVRTPDRTNRLLCFMQAGGAWTLRFQTDAAVPQGKVKTRILVTAGVREPVTGRVYPGPVLTVTEYGSGEKASSPERRYAFLRSGPAEWTLFSAFFAEGQTDLYVDGDSVTFRSGSGGALTVSGSFERDLRRVVLADVPSTPDQARQLFGNRP